MYRYQIWMQHKWHERNASPEEVVYSLDSALLRAKEISKQHLIIHHPTNPFASAYTETRYPVVFVLDCCQVPSRLRGSAFKGKWRDAVDNCNSCNNMSMNADDCAACGGACWKPYRSP